MEKQTIIRLALEAGLHRQQHNLMSNPIQYRYSYDGYEENLERFAALVAAAAKAEEREAILAIERSPEFSRMRGEFSPSAHDLANAIRARRNI